jgi:hypothetical protein
MLVVKSVQKAVQKSWPRRISIRLVLNSIQKLVQKNIHKAVPEEYR